jgi:hypothetical protein
MHSEELHGLYTSSNIPVTKSRMMRNAKDVSYVAEKKYTQDFGSGNSRKKDR